MTASRTVAQHLASKRNLRPSLPPMTPQQQERAKQLPRLPVASASVSPLLGKS